MLLSTVYHKFTKKSSLILKKRGWEFYENEQAQKLPC